MSLFDRTPLPVDPAGALDTLRHALFEEGIPVYVLFDPLLRMPIQRPWREDTTLLAEHAISLAQWGLPMESSPYFVRIHRPVSRLLDDTLSVATKENHPGTGARSVCGWFTSSQENSALCSSLRKQIQQRESSGKRWIFRFYDPRVMRHLGLVLGNTFRVSGVSRWYFLDADSNLASLPGRPVADHLTVVGDANLPLLDRIGLVNQAHSQWRNMDPCVPEDAFDRLFEAAEHAVRRGLNIGQTADCVSFMLHRCLLHPCIERHPLIADWLEDARQGRRSYADAAAEASPAVWDEIIKGHWVDARQGAHHG